MADWKPPKTGSPVWIEITATDLARSHKCYSTVFNWPWKNPEVLTQPISNEENENQNKPVMVDFNPDVKLSGGITAVQTISPPKFAPRPGNVGIIL
ncbi:hypothetical protein V8F06_011699 [Rhypophila decipiens]